mmetsp:Transcript_66593/g.138821  ORF Transcript_66593/g.138821 Transcript_66593/m.138821 type:complete len:86 (+) Transcript_66593:100-357(+)
MERIMCSDSDTTRVSLDAKLELIENMDIRDSQISSEFIDQWLRNDVISKSISHISIQLRTVWFHRLAQGNSQTPWKFLNFRKCLH